MVARVLNHPLLATRITFLQATLGFAMLFASAHIYIPLQPVPITMHTVGVMLVGLSLPYRSAMWAIAAYLAAGLAGVPVFTGWHSGVAVFMGPSAGYLVGFVAAIHVMATLRQRFDFTGWNVAAICMIGQLCIYTAGIAWLTYFMGSLQTALQVGLYPFIVPGLIKAGIVAAALRQLLRA